MKAQSIVFAVVGAFFGLMVGWILGTQYATSSGGAAAVPVAAAQQQGGATPTGKVIDENQVAALQRIVQNDPNNAKSRVELGNLYFDAEQYAQAVRWYEEAMKLDPRDVNLSTDLGVCYYYLNQPDRALQQFDHSLTIDPKHAKTLLNQGVVRAYGKQDLDGAAASWQKVIDIAPDAPEGQNAKRLLDGLRSAHPGGAMPAKAPGGQ